MDLIEGDISDPISHWYYKHKFHFIEKLFRKISVSDISILDVGAGSALFSAELVRLGLVKRVVAVDTGYSDKDLKRIGQITYSRSSSAAGFTHILMTDVLEHINDDTSFLKSYSSEADKQTQFIITVPAMMSLWSSHDVYLKHYRRYGKSELRDLLQLSGLKIHSIRYLYSTVYPVAFFSRVLRKKAAPTTQLRDLPAPLPALLSLALIPDKKISFLPFGVSLFAIAEKC
jgi:hypothetical protein